MQPDYELPPQTGRTPIHVSYLRDPWLTETRLTKWDRRYLERAKHQSVWSKDPNKKVCSIIVDARKHAVSDGFNGLPHGMPDEERRLGDKEMKNNFMIHAEMNALLFSRCDVSGMTLYVWPFAPCDRCAVHIIQAGIKRVVAPMPILESSWVSSQIRAIEAFWETGVEMTYFACEELHDKRHEEIDWP